MKSKVEHLLKKMACAATIAGIEELEAHVERLEQIQREYEEENKRLTKQIRDEEEEAFPFGVGSDSEQLSAEDELEQLQRECEEEDKKLAKQIRDEEEDELEQLQRECEEENKRLTKQIRDEEEEAFRFWAGSDSEQLSEEDELDQLQCECEEEDKKLTKYLRYLQMIGRGHRKS